MLTAGNHEQKHWSNAKFTLVMAADIQHDGSNP